MTQIPERSRFQVVSRDRYLCQRCGLKGTDWHHRRSRSIRDAHTHCPCNGVLLCRTCHSWVHAHPFLARPHGFIVSRYVDFPFEVPLNTVLGELKLDCDGGFVWV